MADAFTWVVRFLHILSAVIWVGGSFTWGMVIAPRILQRGPPPIRRPFLEAALGPFTRLMIVSGALTILTGFWTMGLLVGFDGIAAAFQGSSYGIALGVGVVLAIAMYLEGWFIIKPTGERILATMQTVPPGQPPSEATQKELAALGKKVGIASLTNLVMGTLALGAMAWAVNVVR
ncbi:MAG TPA: hypothetical protein VNX21_02735 [Candidatus Thermoplasmatota archaeon]|nr:hypothetical protein [Candidatus Thermoplasmatota archaeon]